MFKIANIQAILNGVELNDVEFKPPSGGADNEWEVIGESGTEA
jgi:hypothetical protein